MSKLETITIDTPSGSNTMQIGSTNTATINLGVSGDTINVPAGVTIANAGTATGFAPIGISSSMTSGTGLTVDADGHVTQPLQSTFMAQQTGALTVANTHTIFSTNTTERWDTNGDYNNSGTFTAPVTGKYLISVNVLFESISSDDVFETRIVTSNRSYAMDRNSRQYSNSSSYLFNGCCVIADMDASDTAYVTHRSSTTAALHVSGNWSFWSMYLLG